ncbi:TPA: hypothetical protein H1011_00540 [archaeon]|uniref:Uncharacterized protein n=1 Tax=Candidatus Undinarchaeum marinum TaxID=2756141 RepID=A0A832V7Y4_9ARCH|nr:hypothetical protein [Candidatus Undinarchaeum marinum]
MSSNTEDPCEDFTVSMIAGGGNIPAVSGQPCEWREFDGSIDGGWSHFKFEIRFLDSAESIRWQAGNEPRQSNEVSEIIQYLPIISGNNQNVNRIKLTLHTWDSNSDRATRQNVARSGGLN